MHHKMSVIIYDTFELLCTICHLSKFLLVLKTLKKNVLNHCILIMTLQALQSNNLVGRLCTWLLVAFPLLLAWSMSWIFLYHNAFSFTPLTVPTQLPIATTAWERTRQTSDKEKDSLSICVEIHKFYVPFTCQCFEIWYTIYCSCIFWLKES